MLARPIANECLRCLRNAVVKPRTDGSQDGGAGRRGLDAARDPYREPGDIGFDLPPQRALGAAAHDRQSPDLEARGTHCLEDVS